MRDESYKSVAMIIIEVIDYLTSGHISRSVNTNLKYDPEIKCTHKINNECAK